MIQKLIVLVLLIPIKLLSGADSVITTIVPNNQILKKYTDGKIITNNYEKILATDIILYKNVVVLTNSNKQIQKLDYKDILLINAKTGNFAVEGAILGALGGLVLPFSFNNGQKALPTETFIFSTIICTCIGSLIGANMDDYDTIYQNGNLFITLNDNPTDYLRNQKNNEIVAVHFKLNFN
jgi:hypothetical protein